MTGFFCPCLLTVCLLPTLAASETTSNTCHLSSRIELTSPTLFYCHDREMTMDCGTEIITDGNTLEIMTTGNIVFGRDPSDGKTARSCDVTIRSFAGQEHPRAKQNAAKILIYGSIAYGHLTINNFGSTNDSDGGAVVLDYVSTLHYSHTINVPMGTSVQMTRDGDYADPFDYFPKGTIQR